MNTLYRIYRISIVCIASVVPIAATGIELSQISNKTTCSYFLPTDAISTSSFKLCQSDHSGNNELYACQNFTSADGNYRIFFKGGRSPKAITKVTNNGDVKEILWSENMSVNQPVCDLHPSTHIPVTTKFMGAGICKDKNNLSVPCTVFRHKVARLKNITDYMVFYNTNGAGPKYTSTIYMGENQDAMPAELSYQIGLSLLKTGCCQQRALKYIKYAIQMFPDSILYSKSYYHFKTQSLHTKRHQLTSSKSNNIGGVQ